jgi:flagellar hook-associated protein 3 FlgL
LKDGAMKVSTSLFFDRASQQMVAGQQRLSQLQLQLGTGKKINNASDAPDQASTLRRLSTTIAQQESYKKNLGSLTERLENQDTALQNVSSMMIRLRELSVQYANGTLSAEQRRIAAVEVRGVRDQILSLANSRDSNGLGLFNGSRVVADAFDPNGVYQGDQTSNDVPVGDSRAVSNRRTGSDVFIAVIRSNGGAEQAVGFFKVIDDLATALENNQVSGVQRGIGELTQLHQGISLAQADIGSDRNVVDSQLVASEEQLVRLKSLESDLQDVDYAEAVTRMQKEMLSLQAAQSSFAQLSKLNLFNYIG